MSSFLFLGLMPKNFKFEVNGGAYFLEYGVKVRYGTGGVAKPTLPYFLGCTPPPLGGVRPKYGTGCSVSVLLKKCLFFKNEKVRWYGVRGAGYFFLKLSGKFAKGAML